MPQSRQQLPISPLCDKLKPYYSASGVVGRALGVDARSHWFDPSFSYRLRAICEVWYFGVLRIMNRGLSLAGAYLEKIPGTGKFFGACESSSENSLGAARNVLALAVDDR